MLFIIILNMLSTAYDTIYRREAVDILKNAVNKRSETNFFACYFIFDLAVQNYFHLPFLKFGLPLAGAWQAVISSPGLYVRVAYAVTTAQFTLRAL